MADVYQLWDQSWMSHVAKLGCRCSRDVNRSRDHCCTTLQHESPSNQPCNKHDIARSWTTRWWLSDPGLEPSRFDECHTEGQSKPRWGAGCRWESSIRSSGKTQTVYSRNDKLSIVSYSSLLACWYETYYRFIMQIEQSEFVSTSMASALIKVLDSSEA